MKKKINIGIDLGTTSIGLAFVDDDGNVVENPWVFRFKDACDEELGTPKNCKRREFRSARRRITRKIVLKRDFIKFWAQKFNLPKEIIDKCNTKRNKTFIDDLQKMIGEYYENEKTKKELNELNKNKLPLPMYLKLQALNNNKKLSEWEIYVCLYHYLLHKGSFNREFENTKGKIPTLLLEEFYKKNGFVKQESEESKNTNKKNDNDEDKKQEKTINNENLYFSHQDWKKEIQLFFKNQNLDWYDKFINFFDRKRDSSFGPGPKEEKYENKQFDKKYLSKYGLYNAEKGEWDENLWDKTIGFCSVYINEPRFLKNSCINVFYTIIAILNNIVFDLDNNVNCVISKKSKLEFLKSKTISIENLEKIIYKENEIKDIKQHPISYVKGIEEDDKTKKYKNPFLDINKRFKLLNEFINILELKSDEQIFIENDINFENIKEIDKIIFQIYKNIHDDDILENTTDNKKTKDKFCIKEEKLNSLKKMEIFSKYKDNKKFWEYLANNYKSFAKTCKLSQKALEVCVNNMLDLHYEDKNNEKPKNLVLSNLLQHKEKYFKIKNDEVKNKEIISKNITNPTLKKTLKIFIKKVIPKIFKNNDYEINSINIETTRSANTKEEKKRIKNMNDKIKERYDKIKNDGFNINSRNDIKKAYLFNEQNGIDPYSDNKLDKKQLKSYDIDHIIPKSKSHDSSMKNLCLTTHGNNHDKGDKFIDEWLNNDENYSKFEKRIRQMKEGWWSKNFLIKKNNYNSEMNGRQLVDTSYIAITVKNLIKNIIDKNKLNTKNTKINAVCGRFTSIIRNNIKLEDNQNKEKNVNYYNKDRKIYAHHGVDAMCIAFAGLCKRSDQTHIIRQNSYNNTDNVIDIDDELVKKLTNSNIKDYFKKEEIEDRIVANELQNKKEVLVPDTTKFNYWWPKEKSINYSFANQTVYSIDNNNNIKSKINILEIDNDKIKKWFYKTSKKNNEDVDDEEENNSSNLLIKEADYKLFTSLKKIYDEYKNKEPKTNVFLQYMKDNTNIKDFNHKFKYLEIKIGERNYKIKSLTSTTKNNSECLIFNKGNKKNGVLRSLTSSKICFFTGLNSKNIKKTISLGVSRYFLKNDKNKLILDNEKILDFILKNGLKYNNKKEKITIDNINTLKKHNDLYFGQTLKLKKPSSTTIEKIKDFSNDIFIVSGYTSGRIEIKSLSRKIQQCQIQTSTFLENFNIV